MEILDACGGGKEGMRCLPGGGEEDGEAVMVKEGEGETAAGGGGWLGVGGFLDGFEAVERRFSAGEADESSIGFRTAGVDVDVGEEDGRSAPAVAAGDWGDFGGGGEREETAAGDDILMKLAAGGGWWWCGRKRGR